MYVVILTDLFIYFHGGEKGILPKYNKARVKFIFPALCVLLFFGNTVKITVHQDNAAYLLGRITLKVEIRKSHSLCFYS